MDKAHERRGEGVRTPRKRQTGKEVFVVLIEVRPRG